MSTISPTWSAAHYAVSGHPSPDTADWSGMEIANISTSVEDNEWVLVVDAFILSATILGAMSILVSMAYLEWKGRPSTTRTRLVQSLVLSDLALGAVGLVGVALTLHPGGLDPGQSCDGLGVVLVAILWSEHLWTLAIAGATFLILIHPLHRVTLILEKQWWLLWILVWTLSFLISAAGYIAYGLAPSGGICYYPSSTAPLYGPLMQFVPRAAVMAIIALLYAKLFVFLRRPDRIRSSYSSPSASFTERRSRIMSSTFKPIGVISNWFRRSTPADFNKEHVLERRVSIPQGAAVQNGAQNGEQAGEGDRDQENRTQKIFRRPRGSFSDTGLASPTSEIPPWERVELPIFQVDGQKFGGASANITSNNSSNGLWSNWKGMGGGQRDSRMRPSTAGSSTSPQSQSTRKFGSGSSVDALHFGSHRQSPPTIVTPRLQSIPSHQDPLSVDGEVVPQLQNHGMGRGSISSIPPERFRQFSLTSDVPAPGGSLATLAPSDADRRCSANTQGSRRSSTPLVGPTDTQSFFPSGTSKLDLSTEKAGGAIKSGLAQTETSRRGIDGDDGQGDNDWDLMQMLSSTAPPGLTDDRFAPPEGETVELVEESMASYLNRKTALLMLWFPLGYVMLFSVSLIRIIYDFVGSPPVALRAISRWMIFAQGILDAIIYGLVEWHTKRVVRKRVKKGVFGNTHTQSAGTSSWPRFLRPRRTAQSGSNLGQTSGQRRDTEKPTASRQGVTFGGVEERSVLRELNVVDEKEAMLVGGEVRRDSNVDSVDTKGTGTSGTSAGTNGSGASESTASGSELKKVAGDPEKE